MDPRQIPPLPAGSPWAAWPRPDIRHCETNLAGWIAAPADTWSNLAYLAVGAWLIARNPRGSGRSLGAVAVVVGLCSFVFHASYTAQGQFLDYAAMFLLTGWILARGEARAWAAVVGASLGLFAAFRALGVPVQWIMIAHVAAIAVRERRLRERGKAAFALVAAAYACWHMDHSDRFCRPDDHVFQWHAAWHVLTAAAFLPLARAYRGE